MNELEIVRHPQIQGMNIFFDAMEYRTPHFHTEWELMCPLENSLLVCVDAQQHVLDPGEMILLDPRQLHEYQCVGAPCTFLCMQVSESLLPSLRGMCTEGLFPKKAMSKEEYLQAMKLFLSAARAYMLQEPQYELYCIGQAALLFHMLMTKMPSRRMSAEEISTRDQKNARLHRLIQYVDSNFTGKILLRDFAREEGVSMYYLSGFIRKTMNQSYQEYLTTVRFNYACERMVSTDDMLIAISMDSGFSDYRYFSTAVKSRTGHTPEEYRELLRRGGHTDRLARQSKHSREQFLSRRESLLLCDHYLEVYR